MEGLVEAALDHAEAERRTVEQDAPSTEFGPPRAAVIGCGATGGERVGRITSDYRAADDSRETVLMSVALSGDSDDPPRVHDIDDALVWEVPATDDPPTRAASATAPPDRLVSLVEAADIHVLTGALGDSTARRLLRRTTALAAREDVPTVVIPTLPAGPIDSPVRNALTMLRSTADCLVPVDPGQLPPAPGAGSGQPPVAGVTDQLVSAVLGSTSSSMAFPVDLATLHDLFAAGHVAVPVVATLDYDAPLGRSPPDRDAVEASLRTCYDGAGLPLSSSPQGWLAYLVAGDDLTLGAFQRLERTLSEVLVDDADVPSVRGGHIEASREGVGLLSCFVLFE
jgi:cell division protein FtsZ